MSSIKVDEFTLKETAQALGMRKVEDFKDKTINDLFLALRPLFAFSSLPPAELSNEPKLNSEIEALKAEIEALKKKNKDFKA